MGAAAMIPAAASLVGKVFDYFTGKAAQGHADRQALAFAQNSIQWRVADAMKAGVHPLYALGAPTFSPAAQVAGGSSFSDVGQDISRAMQMSQPKDGQLSAFDLQVQKLQLQKFGLENELLASQIARQKQDLLSKPSIPMMLPGGGKFAPGPQTDAQTVQNKYGDIVENVYGTSSLVYDAMKNYLPWLFEGYGQKGPTPRPRGVPARGGYRGGKGY